MTARRRPMPERSPIERAAVLVCAAVYNGQCSCDNSHSPSVCDRMIFAARAALIVMAPEVAERELEEAAKKLLGQK